MYLHKSFYGLNSLEIGRCEQQARLNTLHDPRRFRVILLFHTTCLNVFRFLVQNESIPLACEPPPASPPSLHFSVPCRSSEMVCQYFRTTRMSTPVHWVDGWNTVRK